MTDTPDMRHSPRLARLVRALTALPGRAHRARPVSAAAGWWGSGIPIKGDMEALFPDDTPTTVRAQRARDRRLLPGLTILIGSP